MNHSATTPKGPGSYLFGDDFVDGFDAPLSTSNDDDIRRNAHVANGGEATFTCPSCNGTGRFRTYSGRDGGPCFKCKGKGNVGKRVIAAIKGKETKEANRQAWAEENTDAIRYIQRRAERSTFYASFIEKLQTYGTLTENQMAIVHKDMAADAEFYAKRKAERIANAPVVEISAIEKLFATAVENDVKRPIFRADGIEISRAPLAGRNAGSLYVKRDGEYAGKITDGKFHKVYAAPQDTVDRLMAVAADPLKEAIAYGRKFGNCALCGHDLVDPVSIRAKVGPICAPKWGLNYLRDAARESLAAEKKAEGQS